MPDTPNIKKENSKKSIVTIGGGTGTYTVLSGLKHYTNSARLCAIVTVSDSGGSTGRLRDEFGMLPVGDFRMALAALAGENSSNLLRDLFLYRFNKGSGLDGHNFGNLFLVAMTDILGNEERAIAYASRVLRVQGDVVPVSHEKLTLFAKYADGSIVKGESHIDEPPSIHDATQRIERLWVEPSDAEISDPARDKILGADMIVFGPGDVYTSTLANVVVQGVPEALQASRAKFVCIVNLMSKLGQTHNFSAKDHVLEYEKYIGREVSHILLNNTPLPDEILGRYEAKKEHPVPDDLGDDSRVIRADLLATEEVKQVSGDSLVRSLIRHDSHKLAEQLIALL